MDQLVGGPGQQRPIANCKEAETQVSELAAIQHGLRRQADDSIIAVPPCEFLKEMDGASLCYRYLDGDQQLLRQQCRLIDACEELLRGNPSPANWAAHNDGCA